jgi:zinc transporter 5/7
MIISTLLIERYGWTGFDPISSIFLIFASVVPLVQDSAKILMLCLDNKQETQVWKALCKVGLHSLKFSRERFLWKIRRLLISVISLYTSFPQSKVSCPTQPRVFGHKTRAQYPGHYILRSACFQASQNLRRRVSPWGVW